MSYMHRTKYRAQKTEVDGILFDSKKEAKRYEELKLMQERGEIRDLVLQPTFELQKRFVKDGHTVRAITYTADFMYLESETGKRIVEDVKGMKTDVYKLKKKLFEYKFQGMSIREV